jgi:hypothetical protein
VLDFFQAQMKARDLAEQAKTPATPQAPLTVNEALDAYFARRKREGSIGPDAAFDAPMLHF